MWIPFTVLFDAVSVIAGENQDPRFAKVVPGGPKVNDGDTGAFVREQTGPGKFRALETEYVVP